ncbi:MAG: 16S rRNA (guanine(527)-N(7))-methyltransferase RsmG [Paracoccus sp. (in: a-proteobacteria)]
MDVSRETEALLNLYVALIRQWNPAINLVAPGTLDDLESRHIVDSAQLVDFADPQEGRWIDFGSGGGLPGIVVAILVRDKPISVTLIESDKRKSAFLMTVRRELGLTNLTIKPVRIEALAKDNHAFASARALAPLSDLLPHLHDQLAQQGEAWLLKGRSWEQEVILARKAWSFDLQTYESRTDPKSVVMKLRNIKPNA